MSGAHMLARPVSSSASDDASIASSSSEALSVAIFGTCAFSRCLALSLRSAGFAISGVWGRSARAAEALAHSLNVERWCTREEALLRDPSVCMVAVWTAPSEQAVLFDKAVGLGKSVLCGLPVAVDTAAARRMRSAANEHQLLYMVAQGLRFLPAVTKARAMVADGCLGALRLCTVRLCSAPLTGDHFDWSCDSLMGGGVLSLYGGLVIDLLRYMTQHRIGKVAGSMKTFNGQTEEIKGIRQITADDFCVFEFESEHSPTCGVVTLDASGTSGETFLLEMVLQGTCGRLRLTNCDLFFLPAGAAVEQEVVNDPVTENDVERATGSPDGCMESPVMCKGLLRMADALKLATTESSPEPIQVGVTFEDWLYVQKVVDSIKKAAESRQWCVVRAKSRKSS